MKKSNLKRFKRIIDTIITKLKNKNWQFRFLANYADFDIENMNNHIKIHFWCDKIDKKSVNDITIYRRSDEIEFHSASIVFLGYKKLPKRLELACYECLQKLMDKLNLTNKDYQFLGMVDNPKIYKEFVFPSPKTPEKKENEKGI